MKFSELSVNARAAIITGAIVVVAGTVALAVGLTNKTARSDADDGPPESTATIEATRSAEAAPSGSASTTASAETTPSPEGPSYTKFAYIRSLDGSTVTVDFFVLLAADEAEKYAAEHGLTVPDNGLLFDNPDEKTTKLPLSKDAVIRYATGGLEALSMVPTDAGKLKAWAAGDTDVMPGAMTDWWKVSVEGGVVTRIDMLVVAD